MMCINVLIDPAVDLEIHGTFDCDVRFGGRILPRFARSFACFVCRR